MSRWYTFIGGYYKGAGGNPSKWIAESIRIGVSRKIGMPMACAFEFGDEVVVLVNTGTLSHPGHVAVAQFRVTGISLSHDILKKVLPDFIKDGRVTDLGNSPIEVYRECGSYIEGAAYSVGDDTKMSEIMLAAYKYVRENKIEGVTCLLRGLIDQVFNPPAVIEGLKFTRGFGHADSAMFDIVGGAVIDSTAVNGRVAVTVDDYRRRTSKKPSTLQPPLPGAQYDSSAPPSAVGGAT